MESCENQRIEYRSYQEGDSLSFQARNYLLMKIVLFEKNTYFVLAFEGQSFELIVCLVIEKDQELFLEKVEEESLERKILFRMAEV